MHNLIVLYGCAAVDYHWGYFGAQDGPTMLIAIEHTGTTYTGFTTKSEYPVVGQWSKYVRPGAKRIATSTTAVAGVKISAFKAPTTAKKIVVVYNSTGTAYNIGLNGGGTYRLIRTHITGGTDSLTDKGLYAAWGPVAANSLCTFIEQ